MARSGELNSKPAPAATDRSCISAATTDWVEASSEEIGSSPMSGPGFAASARAVAMRWRWPPENSCG